MVVPHVRILRAILLRAALAQEDRPIPARQLILQGQFDGLLLPECPLCNSMTTLGHQKEEEGSYKLDDTSAVTHRHSINSLPSQKSPKVFSP